jgi:DNA-binding MarR family transcriptional regulator
LKIEEEIKQSKKIDPLTKSVINIMYTNNKINDNFRLTLKEFKINQSQYNILRILRGKGDECANCGQLREVMLDKNPDVTRLCDKLVDMELIEREINSKNKREMLLKINENGRNLLDKIEPKMKKSMKIFDKLTRKEHKLLSDLLDKFRG